MIRPFLRPVAAAQFNAQQNPSPANQPLATRWGAFNRITPAAPLPDHHLPRLRSLDLSEVHELAGFRVEVAQTRGFRQTQEDAFFVSAFAPEKSGEREALLLEAFRHTDALTRDNRCGATCTVALLGADQSLTLAHIGDSPALLFVVDGRTGDVHFKSLLTDHNTLDPFEKERVRQCWGVEVERLAQAPNADEGVVDLWLSAGDVTERGRVVTPGYASLGVSRAFGDRGFDWALARTPDITGYHLPDLLPGLHHADRVFLCVACDGLTELPSNGAKVAHTRLADCLGNVVQGGQADSLAEQLVKHAYQKSNDNITAMVVELPLQGARPTGDLVMCIADGHGGDQTAKQVITHMKAKLAAESRADENGCVGGVCPINLGKPREAKGGVSWLTTKPHRPAS